MNVLENNLREKIFQILMPYAFRQINRFETDGKCLAYYTNTITAKKILENREFWLRNASAMNDYSEVNYGISKINKLFFVDSTSEDKAFRNAGERLKKSMGNFCNSNGDNIFSKALHQFFYEQISWVHNTYIVCFTEHDVSTDRYGRLSMWRAYGGDNGVAFVFKPGYRFQDYERNNNITVTPVAYLDDDEFLSEVNVLTDSIVENEDMLHRVPPDTLFSFFVNLLRYAIVSIKHPGFREEQEWRIIAHSGGVKLETCCARGVVQQVSKLKLCEDNFDDILDHIIIGPTPYENIIYKAFVNMLQSVYSMSNAEIRVFPSRIPYRPV